MKVRDKVFDYESNSVVTVIGFGEKDGRNVIDIPTRIWNFPRLPTKDTNCQFKHGR